MNEHGNLSGVKDPIIWNLSKTLEWICPPIKLETNYLIK
jgi:hypothetical protein